MRHFLFGIHCHQPLDNFHGVLDTAINKSYRPFLQAAAEYPNFKFSVHYSGWLLEFIKDYHKETFKLLQTLAASGQAEFFSGGYYEPILASIPSAYRRLQINKLNDFISDNFGQRPKGLWLTERVWDPSIIPDLDACGMEYVIVDDYHFICSGFNKNSLHGYYQSEQDGCRIKIFPIDQKLRYIVPYKEPEEIDAYLQTIVDEGNPAAVIFDDGEKFGLWPNSYEWVYEKGWLTRFLEYITTQQHVTSTHFKGYVASQKPLGIVYLPSVSYHEMGEWAQFPNKLLEMAQVKKTLKAAGLEEQAEIDVKGGIWQNFLVKYPEANRMHKRSLALALKSLKIDDLVFNDIVCKTQVNDALWHGIFGGLYLPNLRDNVYHYIIEASLHWDKIAQTAFPAVEEVAWDYDGYAKISLRSAACNAVFDMRDNGQMVALENRYGCFNYQNTLARHYEVYHMKMRETGAKADNTDKVISEGEIATIHDAVLEVDDKLKQYLHFDWYNRNSFIDHIVDEFDLKAFSDCTFGELSDFTNRPADSFGITKENDGVAVTFKKLGGIFNKDGKVNLNLTKRFALNNHDEFKFYIKLNGAMPKAYVYVLEFNFHFNDFNALTINGQHLEPDFKISNYAFTISDDNAKALKLTFAKEVELFAAVINTVSQSEKAVDLTPQCVALYVPFEFNGALTLEGALEILG